MKISQRKFGVILSYTGLILGYLISIAYTPIMLRILGQSEFGLYSLVSSIVAYMGVLNFGLGSAYIRYYSKYKTNNQNFKVANLNGTFLLLYSIIGAIAILAGCIISFNFGNFFGESLSIQEIYKSKILMIILSINLGLSFPSSIFSFYLTSNEEFVFQKLIEILKIFISPFVTIPILFLGYGSVGLVMVSTILNIVVTISYALYCSLKLNIKFTFNGFETNLVKELFAFSSFIFINMIIDQINWNVDKLIIAKYRGTVAIAVYGISSQLNSYYISISSIISSVFIPKVHNLVNGKRFFEITELFIKIGRIQFFILILVLSNFILFGRQFIILWIGIEYIESFNIGILLLIPVTVPLIQNIGIEVQQAMNMHQFRSVVYFLIALINIFISIPLTKEFGAIGAAFGTTISLLIGNGFIMNWYYKNKININVGRFWREIFSSMPSFILPISVGIVITKVFVINNYWLLILCCTLYSITYIISVYLFSLNNYEKDLFARGFKYFNINIENRKE